MQAFFSHKNTSIFQGNCLDKSIFDKEFIDLIVTSPPYNVGIDYNSNDDELNYEQIFRIFKKMVV